ncbi:hypothetical protein V8E36_006036 [Tilletia maclaganii]
MYASALLPGRKWRFQGELSLCVRNEPVQIVTNTCEQHERVRYQAEARRTSGNWRRPEPRFRNQRLQWEVSTKTLHPTITINSLDFALGHEETQWNEAALEILAQWAELLEAPAKEPTEE